MGMFAGLYFEIEGGECPFWDSVLNFSLNVYLFVSPVTHEGLQRKRTQRSRAKEIESRTVGITLQLENGQ